MVFWVVLCYIIAMGGREHLKLMSLFDNSEGLLKAMSAGDTISCSFKWICRENDHDALVIDVLFLLWKVRMQKQFTSLYF